jgi:Ca-activated chloride channel homolog
MKQFVYLVFGLIVLLQCSRVEAQTSHSTTLPTGIQVSPVLPNREHIESSPRVESQPPPASVPFSFKGCENILFVLDSSFSMKEKVSAPIYSEKTKTKLEFAKSLIERILASLPTDAKCGLRIFGAKSVTKTLEIEHNPNLNHIDLGPGTDCLATELLVPIKEGNKKLILRELSHVLAIGNATPLEFALRQAYGNEVATVKGHTVIILLTDGYDTCGGDPVRFVNGEVDSIFRVNLVVASFAQNNRHDIRPLDNLVRAGNGKYYDAFDFDELISDVKKAGVRN